MNLYKKNSPPKADIIPHYHLEHGNERVDNYYWLKDIKNPKVIDYLKKENQNENLRQEYKQHFELD